MANHRNFAETTLAAAITDTSGTSITVTSEASFPAAPFIISIDTECLLVTVVSGTTWTVTRGYEGSTAATHTNGTAIYHDISAAEADSIAAKLALAGGTMSGDINMGNKDISYLKLLKLNGEINDGNSGTAKMVNLNAGAVHKLTLTGNVTIAFTGTADILPAMTANDAPTGYVASSLSVNATFYPWHAFDDAVGSDAGIWMAADSASGGTPQWLQIQLPSAVVVASYAITARNLSGYNYPQTWTLQASDDGASFTTIDTRSTQSFSAGEKKTYTITSPTSHRYYRLVVTANATGVCGLDEMELLGGVDNPPAPCFLALKVIQDATGGRKITWPATVKGVPLYDLAANAVTVLLFYWDGTYYWPLNNSGWVSTVPASATAKGIAGQYTANGSYFYYCSATDTWVRAALATWA